MLSAEKLHGDDVPAPVLVWTYVRNDRPAGNDAASAVWFAYSPDRKGEHPARHLKNYRGIQQAYGYAGFTGSRKISGGDHRRNAKKFGNQIETAAGIATWLVKIDDGEDVAEVGCSVGHQLCARTLAGSRTVLRRRARGDG